MNSTIHRKVCVVTTSRSEYGLLRWVINAINTSNDLSLQLVVTGSHLLEEYGNTYKEIESDGYSVAKKVDFHLDGGSLSNIVESMGRCLGAFSGVFSELKPDLLLVLGDRYELLPICSAALIMRIPISHISGGDVTIGAIDNEIRNAVTMMSSLHFPGVKESANNIIRMRASEDNVYVVGEPGLENFKKLGLLNRSQLANELGLHINRRWVLVTVHPETQRDIDYNLSLVKNTISALCTQNNLDIVFTKSNADYGGTQINSYIQSVVDLYPDKLKLFSSLGQLRYLSFMKESFAVVGNSSSGIVEAPHLAKPVINIGDRQLGRHMCNNIFQARNCLSEILNAWKNIESTKELFPDFYYGDGDTSGKIVSRIIDFLDEK